MALARCTGKDCIELAQCSLEDIRSMGGTEYRCDACQLRDAEARIRELEAERDEADGVLERVNQLLRDTAERLGLLDDIPDAGSLRSDASCWDARLFEAEILRLRADIAAAHAKGARDGAEQ